MALAEQSQLIVTIRLNDQMSPGATKVGGQITNLERKTVSLQRATKRLGEGLKTGIANSAKIAAVGVGFLAYNIKQGADAIARYQAVTAQTSAVLKSTRQAAGLTAKDVARLSANLEDLTGIEAEANQEAANVLLTFTNISKKVFPQTLAIVADISTAMGTDMKQQSVQLGKALNDPIRGMSALTDVGVTFSDQQRKMITRLQESGRTVKAQKIILAELRKEFGGSAVAADKTFGGSLRRLRNATTDLQSALAAPLIKPIARLARRLSEFAKNPEVIQGLRDLGTAIAGMFSEENIDAGFEAMKNGIQFLKDLDWSQVSQAVSTSAEIMKTTVGMFMGLPAPLKGALISFLAINKLTGGLGTAAIKGIGELLLSNLKTINAANVTVIGANVATGVGGAGGGGIIDTILGGAGALIGGAAGAVQSAVGSVLGGTAGAVAGGAVAFAPLALIQSIVEPVLSGLFPQVGKGALEGLRGFGPKAPAFGTGLISAPGAPGAMRAFQALQAAYAAPFTPVSEQTRANAIEFDAKLGSLVEQGKISQEYALKLFVQTQTGVRTYKEALKELEKIGDAQKQTRDAVRGARYQFTLKPSVTISASATGNAITFAANGQRLEIL